MIQERKLAAYIKECEQQVMDIQQDGERRVAHARNEKTSREKELDRLIRSHPKQQDDWANELEKLKASNAQEIALAESKVRAMLENKQFSLERASAKLLNLRQETANIERELDEARKMKVLAGLEHSHALSK